MSDLTAGLTLSVSFEVFRGDTKGNSGRPQSSKLSSRISACFSHTILHFIYSVSFHLYILIKPYLDTTILYLQAIAEQISQDFHVSTRFHLSTSSFFFLFFQLTIPFLQQFHAIVWFSSPCLQPFSHFALISHRQRRSENIAIFHFVSFLSLCCSPSK